ncbi:unnamed protein product [Closterium sp. Naga37s-1]|nr:unnamed protein product [Closterium sp. Naga37s-1]
MAPILALTSLPLRFSPHTHSTLPPLLPLPSLPSASLAAPSSPFTTSPTCRWTPLPLHPSAWVPLSHRRPRLSALDVRAAQLIRSQDVIFDETRSPFLTPPPTPPAPSLNWSDFDPLPSAVPSPPPLPPAPAPPPLPASSTPPSAVISGISPPASSSSAPMAPPSSPPSATLPSAPAPPPSPRITRSLSRAMCSPLLALSLQALA